MYKNKILSRFLNLLLIVLKCHNQILSQNGLINQEHQITIK